MRTLNLTIVIPDEKVAPASDVIVPNGNYHYSTTRKQPVRVSDMHECWMYNALRLDILNGLTFDDIRSDPAYAEMFYRMSQKLLKEDE